MPAYLIADIEISDPSAYEEYKKSVSPLIAKFGGRYLVRAGEFEVLEGDWSPHRLVMLEFPTMEVLNAWYESPEYQQILAIRQASARSSIVKVQGL